MPRARNGRGQSWAAACGLLGLWVCLSAAPASADTPPDNEPRIPEELVGVGINEQLNVQLPLDLPLVDENNRDVRLSDYFDGKHPVVLTLNFYRCRTLCNLQLNGLIDALEQLDESWTPGRQYRIVTLSFDPLETPVLAKAKKESYIAELGRSEAAAGWHFLTGDKPSIKQLTERVGFSYKWNEETQQWAHGSSLILITPDGRVSRYLGGVYYDPKVLRLSLVEASQGRIGSLWDQVFLICFHYVSSEGKYVPAAWAIMRIGGGLTVIIMLLAGWRLFRSESRRRRAALAAGHAAVIG